MQDRNSDGAHRSVRSARPSHRRRRTAWYFRRIAVFFTVFFVMSAVSWLLPLRPTHSTMENRDLTAFPAFSLEALASGDYFDGINLWFADTFPMRDGLMGISRSVKALYGAAGDTAVHGEVQIGDEIPDVPTVATVQSDPAETTTAPTETTASAAETTTTAPIPMPGGDKPLTESFGAVLTIGDSGFEYYNFVQSTADSYIATVSRAADQLAGKATVYDIVVPTSMDICVPDALRSGLNSSDQRRAIEYISGSMGKAVHTVPVFDTLLNAHKAGKYVYFRTDHHWTADGAYLAYEQLCAAKGITPTPQEEFTVHRFDGLLGSFYRDTQREAMAANPDVVYAYEPAATNDMTYFDADGNAISYSIITDVTDWDQTFKYNTFIAGDQPLAVIENPTLSDGSSCVLVKESFGNAFAPFLVANYQTVYIVDYRYFHNVYDGGLQQFVAEKGISDVIFLNNVSATRNDSLMDYLSYLVR